MNTKNTNFKNSGIAWIGQIPKHWEISKIKYVANLFTGNSIRDSQKDNFMVLLKKSHLQNKNYLLFKTNFLLKERNIRKQWRRGQRIQASQKNLLTALPKYGQRC